MTIIGIRAPVRAGDLVERHLDADRTQAFLHQHAERLADNAEAEIERQRRLETAGHARLGEQRLGFVEVRSIAMRLRPNGVGGAVAGRAVHRLGEAEHHRVHDLLIGHGIGDGLAHLHIIERRLLGVHAEIPDAVADRR